MTLRNRSNAITRRLRTATALRRRELALAGLALAGACQAAPRSAVRPASGPRDRVVAASTARADAGTGATTPGLLDTPPSWLGLSDDWLQRSLLAHVARYFAQHAPPFDVAAWDPRRPDAAAALPALDANDAEVIQSTAVVALSRGDAATAAAICRAAIARLQNPRGRHFFVSLLAEAQRRLAGDDPTAQATAVAAVLATLPRSWFAQWVEAYGDQQIPGQLDRELAAQYDRPISGTPLSAVLRLRTIDPARLANTAVYDAAIDQARRALDAAHPTPRSFAMVDLRGARDARPVRVAVIDAGVAVDRFTGRLFANPGERPDGVDNDHDGEVDDLHGLALAVDAPADNTALTPLAMPADRQRLALMVLAGATDVQVGRTSTEAARGYQSARRQVIAAGGAARIDRALHDDLMWVHGTHTASQVLDGLPGASSLVVFNTLPAMLRRNAPGAAADDDYPARYAHELERVARFVQRFDVRVVNISFDAERDSYELALRGDGVAPAEAARRAQARSQQLREAFAALFRACPATLFVVSAGNLGVDLDHDDGMVPQSIDAPNLLLVGAVDGDGEVASFSNYGPRRVRVYDQGVDVDGLAPDGSRLHLSGTSFAAPRVANLAAKLRALDPALTPAETVGRIVETGDAVPSAAPAVIANQARAVARTREARRPAGAARR